VAGGRRIVDADVLRFGRFEISAAERLLRIAQVVPPSFD
jgi:hypothetical protein